MFVFKSQIKFSEKYKNYHSRLLRLLLLYLNYPKCFSCWLGALYNLKLSQLFNENCQFMTAFSFCKIVSPVLVSRKNMSESQSSTLRVQKGRCQNHKVMPNFKLSVSSAGPCCSEWDPCSKSQDSGLRLRWWTQCLVSEVFK